MKNLIVLIALFYSWQLAAANTYVLVHGAWADEHAWDAVKPLLETKGHRVLTVNLPGHGADNTPVGQITLQSYVDAVVNTINKQEGKVILVGHSMAGIVVSQVAEKIPQKIRCIVYVAAYLPVNQEDLLSISKKDSVSLIGTNLEFSPDYSTAAIKKDVLVPAIAADCPAAVQEAVVKYHKAEPTGPLGEKVTLSTEKFGKVKKYYIETTDDKAVGNPLQRQMVLKNGGIKKVFTLHTGHLPFLAQPQQFVKYLLKAK